MTLHDRIADIWNTVQPDSVDDEGCPVWTNEGLAAAVLADPEIKAALELAERTVNVQTIAQEAAAAEREACAQIVLSCRENLDIVQVYDVIAEKIRGRST